MTRDRVAQVSIILAGYQGDIEKKLLAYNVGLASRVETVMFDDFTFNQLVSIWRKLCKDSKVLVCTSL